MRIAVALIPLALVVGCSRPAAHDISTAEASGQQGDVVAKGLKQPVEILRDRWGVPHIYAQNSDDLFFANGWINAKDRLFQIDLWRRTGTGKLAEVLGASYIERDRMARLFRYRGDWKAEWQSYSPDAYQILRAFTNGVNAYIKSLNGKRTSEFQVAGYDPGLWTPEDCVARIAGLSIMGNAPQELQRAQDITHFGLPQLLAAEPLDPPASLAPVPGIELARLGPEILRGFSMMVASSPFAGSNNWVVDGTRSVTGKPLLASDPHRNLEVPSLRKTVHLVAPGWNVIGSAEPALPGIAIGHNEEIAFGFTITGTDQEDLYVERLNPKNHNEYWFQGAWKRVDVSKEQIAVKDAPAREVELRFTVHGPIVYEDASSDRAFALKTVAMEPGGAGYLSMLATSRAKDWNGFRASLTRFKTPSENLLYADRAGNIGMAVAGYAPVRPNWTGLLPVPGTGEYEWSGFVPTLEMPAVSNPSRHLLATANNKVIPPGYQHRLTYDWGPPYRVERIEELLSLSKKFSVADFETMQYDETSVPARRFQKVLQRWHPEAERQREIVKQLLGWDARVASDSPMAMVYEIWTSKLCVAMFGRELALRARMEGLLKRLESSRDLSVLSEPLMQTLAELDRYLGSNQANWQWGRLTAMTFRHPLKVPEWNRGPIPRGGDPNTINASAGGGSVTAAGASYRQVIDLADWDRSTMTNVPGESGDPASPHYSDLIQDWTAGRYHPMAYSRKAVESVTAERFVLKP